MLLFTISTLTIMYFIHLNNHTSPKAKERGKLRRLVNQIKVAIIESKQADLQPIQTIKWALANIIFIINLLNLTLLFRTYNFTF
jgi:hypothetical protein